jgi:hypothetical protein
MRIRKSILVVMLASGVLAGCSAMSALSNSDARVPAGEPTAPPEGEGWINLFSVEHADGWKNVTDDQEGLFTLEDGVFHIFGQESTRYLAYAPQAFGDFEMHIEFKVTENANSGVFFRSSTEDPVYAGMEIQVFDSFGDAPDKNSCGALYDIATPMFNMARPVGEWNSLDITCKGPEVTVVCNGWTVLHLDLAKMTMPIGKFDTPLAQLPQTGHIILQDHGHEVWYRNLLVRPL